MPTFEVAKDKLRYWREAPDGAIQFVRDQFKAEPDDWQRDALMAYQHGKPRTVLKACKNPGKTAVLSWCSWHFLTVWDNPNIGATSISGDNLRDNLWKEMAKWQLRSKMLSDQFQWTAERIFLKTRAATWWMSARKWAKTADTQQQSATLAGLHSDYVMFVLDETGSMPRAVMASADAALGSGIVSKLLQAGNPERLEGPLYDACTSELPMWNLIEATGDPDDPKRAKRVDLQWAKDQIAKYGKDSPWVLVNVFGKFPPASLNALLGIEDVREAMARVLPEDAYTWSQKRLGVDVARFGDDLTVLAPRQGLQWFKPVPMSHPRGSAVSVDIASRVAMAETRWKFEMEFYDDTVGWAHGAIDVRRAAGKSPMPVSMRSAMLRSALLQHASLLLDEDGRRGEERRSAPERARTDRRAYGADLHVPQWKVPDRAQGRDQKRLGRHRTMPTHTLARSRWRTCRARPTTSSRAWASTTSGTPRPSSIRIATPLARSRTPPPSPSSIPTATATTRSSACAPHIGVGVSWAATSCAFEIARVRCCLRTIIILR